jgi:hypothetical protein
MVGVIEHNGHNRDRAQALDVCAKLAMRRPYCAVCFHKTSERHKMSSM